MSIIFALAISSIAVTLSQFLQDCIWDEFTLQEALGYEIQCIDGDFAYSYTPCTSYPLCNTDKYQAVYINRNNGQCEYYLSQWDEGSTVPIFTDNNGNYSWTFVYTNGQISAQCNEIQFDIIWQCDENATPFSAQTKCGKISNNDCHHSLTVFSVYACVNPTDSPTINPTIEPTIEPSNEPTINPTIEPTISSGGSSQFLTRKQIITIGICFSVFAFCIIIAILVYCMKFKKPKERSYHRALLKRSIDNRNYYSVISPTTSKKSGVQLSTAQYK
eukprot:19748_1